MDEKYEKREHAEGSGLQAIEPGAASVMLHEDFTGEKEDLAHDDLDIVLEISDRKCCCTDEQKRLAHAAPGEIELCEPCEARILLNRVHTTAHKGR